MVGHSVTDLAELVVNGTKVRTVATMTAVEIQGFLQEEIKSYLNENDRDRELARQIVNAAADRIRQRNERIASCEQQIAEYRELAEALEAGGKRGDRAA